MTIDPETRASLKKPLRYLLFFSFLIGLMIIAAHFPSFIERYYSGGVYIGIAAVTQFVFNRVPFSAGDLLYIVIIGALVFSLAKIIISLFQKRFGMAGKMLLKLTVAIQLAILIFYLFWGLNYFREPASKRFGMADSCCFINDIGVVTRIMIDSANHYRSLLTRDDLRQADRALFDKAGGAVKRLSVDRRFKATFPRLKPSLLSWLMNYMGTAGYYNPFTSEAQLNYQMPVYIKPFTGCHELSHQMGFAPEDEASFSGFLACVNSRDKLFKYSAYYSVLQEFMFELRLRDTVNFKEMKLRISAPVLADLKAEHDYWMSYRGKAGLLSSLMYDNYLRLNNQPKGLKTYNEVVRLLTGWYRKRRTFTYPDLPVLPANPL